MKIIKRNGAEVVFDIDKIRMAVTKANNAVEESVRMTPLQISRIAESVEISCEEMGRSPAVIADNKCLLFCFEPVLCSLICRIFCFKVQIVILSLIILCVLKNDCRHANVLFCLSSGFMQVKF